MFRWIFEYLRRELAPTHVMVENTVHVFVESDGDLKRLRETYLANGWKLDEYSDKSIVLSKSPKPRPMVDYKEKL